MNYVIILEVGNTEFTIIVNRIITHYGNKLVMSWGSITDIKGKTVLVFENLFDAKSFVKEKWTKKNIRIEELDKLSLEDIDKYFYNKERRLEWHP